MPLQKELDVPVGLMVGAVGGTPSGYWLSEEAFRADAACQEVVEEVAGRLSPRRHRKYEQDLAKWEKDVGAAKQKGEKRLPGKPSRRSSPASAAARSAISTRATSGPSFPYAIRGVLWDQGESGTAIDGVDQYTLMGALIRGWRNEWGQGDFPFIYIQKPSGGGCAWDPADPVTREREQVRAAAGQRRPGDAAGTRNSHPHHAISQHGHGHQQRPGLGHPSVEQVGLRRPRRRVALGMVYGKKIEYYGPVYKSHKVEGNKIRIKFTHVGQGLAPGMAKNCRASPSPARTRYSTGPTP